METTNDNRISYIVNVKNIPTAFNQSCSCGHIAGEHKDIGILYKGTGACNLCKCTSFTSIKHAKNNIK